MAFKVRPETPANLDTLFWPEESDGDIRVFVGREDFPDPIEILVFAANGETHRSPGVPDNLGLKVDGDGRIVISD